ncbi:MAG: PEP-CTERM sorting domain-containing protein [Rhodobacteraceae bacterium]|nr:PEP-CTERM sorting domain-containing protein [Paracoccaceae bacterium]
MLKTIKLLGAAFVICAWGSAANAAAILVFGDYSSSRNTLASDLAAMGHTVTNSATLASDLSGFDTIWHVGAFAPLTAGEQGQLSGFLASGGGIHLTGERPCCEVLNDSLQDFVNGVVIGGGITVGDQGDIGGPYNFNPNAAGGVTAGLTTWVPSASGGMAGLGLLPDPNILVTGAGNVAVGGVWDSGDLVSGGRLTLMMDVNWFSIAARIPVIENIEAYLEGGSANPSANVPAPGALALLGLGLLGLGARRRLA